MFAKSRPVGIPAEGAVASDATEPDRTLADRIRGMYNDPEGTGHTCRGLRGISDASVGNLDFRRGRAISD